MAVDFEQECFFIAPIGEKGTDIRKRSDGVRDWVVRPAAQKHGLETVRADDVGEPGQITSQAVQHCLKAKAAVADLTGGNPNVYYELSVRHGAQLPVVLIAEEGTKLPFDVGQSRVIFFDHTDLSDAGRAREELEQQIDAALRGPPDNPIADGMRLARLEGGDIEDQTLALIMDRLERVVMTTEDLKERFRRDDRRKEIEAAGKRIIRDPKSGTVYRYREGRLQEILPGMRLQEVFPDINEEDIVAEPLPITEEELVQPESDEDR